jgi:tetratricopeptide (TPR) repeat protein
MKHRPSPRRARLALGLLAAAVVLFGTALLALPSSAPPQGRFGAGEPSLGVRARVAYAERSLVEAERLAREHLRTGVVGRADRLFLARILTERGRLEEARTLAEAALKEDPRDPAAHRTLAAVYRGMGQADLALVHLHRAAALRKDDALVWRELGLLQREKGDLLGALSSLQQALTLDPGQSDLSLIISELATGKDGLAGLVPASAAGAGARDPLDPRPVRPEQLVPRAPGSPSGGSRGLTGLPRP